MASLSTCQSCTKVRLGVAHSLPFVLARILNLLEVLFPEVADDLVIVSTGLPFHRARRVGAHLAARETPDRDNHRDCLYVTAP